MHIVHLAESTQEKPKRQSKTEAAILSAKNWMLRQEAQDRKKAEAKYRSVIEAVV